MAQFPVSDNQGIEDAVNYLLSGPTASGQNFAGFSFSGASGQFDLTGNFRPPFTVINNNSPGVPNVNLYVAPISLGTSQMLDGRTFRFNFGSAQGSAPFAPGQTVTIAGVADPFYDGTYNTIGCVECTTTYVIVRTSETYAIEPNSTGGTASLDSMSVLMSTDCNAKVTITSNTDRVVVSGQLNNQIFFDTMLPGSFTYEVFINRYRASQAFDPVNPDFRFNPDEAIAYKSIILSTPIAGISLDPVESIFTSIIDTPPPGYYWYILEVRYTNLSGGVIITNSLLSQRSFSAQVLKE